MGKVPAMLYHSCYELLFETQKMAQVRQYVYVCSQICESSDAQTHVQYMSVSSCHHLSAESSNHNNSPIIFCASCFIVICTPLVPQCLRLITIRFRVIVSSRVYDQNHIICFNPRALQILR